MMAIRCGLRLLAPNPWSVALAIVLLAALAVRLFGIDWDDGNDLHPDELFITKFVLNHRIHLDWPIDINQLLDPARSGLNPRSADPATGKFREFAYGALPLWITDAVAWFLSRLTGVDWNATDRAYLVGRALSAILSAATVLPIAALGVATAGRAVGLLTAIFAALAPMSIQLAHFFTTDSWLAFFVACALLACVAAAESGKPALFAAAGAMFGLAMATKGSVFALAAPIVVAIAIDGLRRSQGVGTAKTTRAVVSRSAMAACSSLVAFLAFEPYAFIRLDVYLHSLRVQADIASGAFDVPFTRVYAGTTPLLYQVEQFVRWGYGPVAGLLALVGIGFLVEMARRRRATAPLILCSWLAAYGGVILLSDVKFLRYLEPLAPVFAIGAALAVVKFAAMLKASRWRIPHMAVPLLALALSAAWSGAFLSVYAHEHPRLTASRWIYGEIPPGSTLTAEYWDDALPRGLSYVFSPALFGLGSITMDLYRDLPPAEASDAIFRDLTRADLVVQSSERGEAAVHAAPWRYPVQGRYYAQLHLGTLGFAPAATFERAPAIGPVRIDDREADESFVNYDHPRVSIHERRGPLSRETFDAAMAWAFQRPWFPSRAPPEPTLLLDTPVGQNPSVNDARWSATVTTKEPAALAVWLLLLIALLAVGLPIARFLLPMFPDFGWGLARVLALTVTAYAIWLGASLEALRFRAVWVLAALLIVGGVGWLATKRAGRLPPFAKTGPHWRAPLHAEAAFWLVLLLFLAFRLANPDGWHPLWGGEKPMEFAQINAIARSAYFPPYDPWYADGYVNYYYYGFYLMAFLFKATGVPAEIGFNLALPTVMGMIASGGFSVAAAVGRGLTRSPRLGIVAGWLGAIFLCLIGNLSTLRGIVEGPPAGADPFLSWTWGGSRVIDYAITEFPFFSGLYADLHAHVVALPLTIATIALCLAVASTPLSARPWRDRQSRGILPRPTVIARLLVLSLLIGSLGVTNAWDLPVYAVLAIASVFMATAKMASWPRRAVATAAISLLVLFTSWLLFLPFHRHFVVLFSQLALVRDPTDPLQFLTHLGGLLAICAVGAGVLLVTTRGAAFRIQFSPAANPGHAWVAALPLVIAFIVVVAAAATGRSVLAMTLAVGGVAAGGWFVTRRTAERFVCLLLAAAMFTAAGAELVVVADDLIGSRWYRMNTVFKFYNQIWVLLALAGAAFAALMIRESSRRRSERASGARSPWGRRGWATLGTSITAVVLLASLAYPVLATGPRLALRFTPGTESGTLDALGWMRAGTVPTVGHPEYAEIAFAGDAAAIAWLNANVSGSPVIAEASIGPYRCNGSRISAATGLPTIIGWERHQQQQRYPETLPRRVEDVRLLYTSSDPAEKTAILRRYNAEYVIVGDLERRYPIADNECTPTGSADGIAAFDAMLGTTLEVAHAAAGTTIYRVLPLDTV